MSHYLGDDGRTTHYAGTVTDVTGHGQKTWSFQTVGTQFNAGLQLQFDNIDTTTNTVVTHEDYPWAQDSASRPYLPQVVTKLDNNANYQKTTTQTIDQHGNLTQMQVFNYPGLTPRCAPIQIPT